MYMYIKNTYQSSYIAEINNSINRLLTGRVANLARIFSQNIYQNFRRFVFVLFIRDIPRLNKSKFSIKKSGDFLIKKRVKLFMRMLVSDQQILKSGGQ